MIYQQTDSGVLYQGNSLDVLRSLADESIDCCVTSPPYWGLRDYGTATWEGGYDPGCDHRGEPLRTRGHINENCGTGKDVKNKGAYEVFITTCLKCGARRKDSQLGLERTPEEYVSNMVQLFRDVRRVLKQDGTLWLNLGDSYHQNKNLVGIPWRVAFALQADGWYLRQDIIWHKPNPMPESVKDRCTKSHEYIFLMSKSGKYFFDSSAMEEEANYDGRKDMVMKGSAKYANGYAPDTTTVQSIAVTGHQRWKRKYGEGQTGGDGTGFAGHSGYSNIDNPFIRNKRSVWTVPTKPFKGAHFATFPITLIEPMIRTTRPNAVILDPFFGSGTTGLCAVQNGRRYVGIDLNPEYCEIAAKRIESELAQGVIEL